MRQDNKKEIAILFIVGIIPVIWLSLLIAPFIQEGLTGIVKNLPIALNTPFKISFCKDSIRCILLFLLVYGLSIGVYYSTKGNYRRREEHGSAKWGDSKQLDKRYKQLPECNNKILTQNVKLGLNGKKHRRNLNILVCGGSGSGKTRFFGKPNVMQCSKNSSYVILDPKGEILRDTGTL